MREHPIIFNTEMVRAILDGRKTQTRRPHKASIWNIGFSQICPFGQVGDRLWVRETWWESKYEDEYGAIYYRADCPKTENHLGRSLFKWRPSIHMPKWAARIWLEITGIRVERVQDISGKEAIAEGWNRDRELFPTINPQDKAKEWFSKLWDSLYGKTFPWNSNPWVWVIEFKRVDHES